MLHLVLTTAENKEFTKETGLDAASFIKKRDCTGELYYTDENGNGVLILLDPPYVSPYSTGEHKFLYFGEITERDGLPPLLKQQKYMVI